MWLLYRVTTPLPFVCNALVKNNASLTDGVCRASIETALTVDVLATNAGTAACGDVRVLDVTRSTAMFTLKVPH